MENVAENPTVQARIHANEMRVDRRGGYLEIAYLPKILSPGGRRCNKERRFYVLLQNNVQALLVFAIGILRGRESLIKLFK